jgi:Trk K+ transport system NAD-binding subunit
LVLAKNHQDRRSDHTSLAILLTIEDIKRDVFSVAELVDHKNREFFERTGCDAIVCLTGFTTHIMVQELLDPGVQSVIDQLTSTDYGQQLYVVDMDAPEQSFEKVQEWAGKQQAILLGYARDGETEVNPPADTKLRRGDRLVLIATRRPKRYAG